MKKQIDEDPVLEALLDRYFALALKENYPDTPKTTQKLDKLQTEIRARKAHYAGEK